MTTAQTATHQVYASIPMPTRLLLFDDLVSFAKSESDPLVRAGIMYAAHRLMSQMGRLEREKRHKA